MGLITDNDRRPRDWAYRAAFDRKDLPSLQEMARHIRETHDTDMIEDFNLKCEQKLKLSGTTTILDNGIEIQAVTKTEDLVVNGGLDQCIKIIQGTNTSRWTVFGFTRNSGTNPPQITNTSLDNSAGGPWYVSVTLYGWSEPKGMKMFFGVITPQDVNNTTFSQASVHEMGLVTPSVILLNRELFYNNPVSRILSADGKMYQQVFMFSSVIEFCPVA